jgi:hypothetical protein
MKRKFLIIISLFLGFLDANGQWYYRHYGVKDINELSTIQLDYALYESKIIADRGLLGMATGVVEIIGGLVLINSYSNRNGGDLSALFGFFFTLGAPITFTYGVVQGIIGGARISQIKNSKNYFDLKIGFIEVPPPLVIESSKIKTIKGLSLTLIF